MSSRPRNRPEDTDAEARAPIAPGAGAREEVDRPPSGNPADDAARDETDHLPSADPSDDDSRACRRVAMGLLARREHSRLELERKLSERSHSADVIARVLDELEQSGLLADARFAESFVRARVARGQGPVRIRRELAGHGIGDASAWLGADAYDWPALARGARVKRFGRDLPRDFKEKARQCRFLEYRGFTSDQIAAALEFGDESD